VKALRWFQRSREDPSESSCQLAQGSAAVRHGTKELFIGVLVEPIVRTSLQTLVLPRPSSGHQPLRNRRGSIDQSRHGVTPPENRLAHDSVVTTFGHNCVLPTSEPLLALRLFRGRVHHLLGRLQWRIGIGGRSRFSPDYDIGRPC